MDYLFIFVLFIFAFASGLSILVCMTKKFTRSARGAARASKGPAKPSRAADEDYLLPRQRKFAQEYGIFGNATEAALCAGYSPNTAAVQGHELLKNPKIQKIIQAQRENAAKSVGVRAEDVLRELSTRAFLDPIELFENDGTLLPLANMSEKARRSIVSMDVVETFEMVDGERQFTGYIKKVRLMSKEAVLTLLGKNMGMFNEPAPEPPAPVSLNIKFVGAEKSENE